MKKDLQELIVEIMSFCKTLATTIYPRCYSSIIRQCTRILELEYYQVKIGIDPRKFGWYAYRLGGTTGVPDRMFKQHGRWKIEVSKDRYVQFNRNPAISFEETPSLECFQLLLAININ